jgi:hypothetical protein
VGGVHVLGGGAGVCLLSGLHTCTCARSLCMCICMCLCLCMCMCMCVCAVSGVGVALCLCVSVHVHVHVLPRTCQGVTGMVRSVWGWGLGIGIEAALAVSVALHSPFRLVPISRTNASCSPCTRAFGSSMLGTCPCDIRLCEARIVVQFGVLAWSVCLRCC